MITLEEAKNLRYGEILIDPQGKRWKVNGEVKTWKRDSSKLECHLSMDSTFTMHYRLMISLMQMEHSSVNSSVRGNND